VWLRSTTDKIAQRVCDVALFQATALAVPGGSRPRTDRCPNGVRLAPKSNLTSKVGRCSVCPLVVAWWFLIQDHSSWANVTPYHCWASAPHDLNLERAQTCTMKLSDGTFQAQEPTSSGKTVLGPQHAVWWSVNRGPQRLRARPCEVWRRHKATHQNRNTHKNYDELIVLSVHTATLTQAAQRGSTRGF